MGVSKWFKEVLPHVKSGKKVKARTLDKKIIGVDISNWLYVISNNSEEYCLRSNIKPLYPPRAYLDLFKSRHRALTRNGIIPVYIFDGRDHILKSVARSERDRRAAKALEELEKLKNIAREKGALTREQEANVCKHMKATAKPTDERREGIIRWLKEESTRTGKEIRVVMAPFEAEWQLVFEEKAGRIDGILTQDSDTIVLGAKNVYIDFSMSDYFSRSTILSTYKKPKDSGLDMTQHMDAYLPEIAALLGCDYVSNIPDQGSKKIPYGPNCLFLQYIRAENKKQFIEAVPKCPPGHFERMQATRRTVEWREHSRTCMGQSSSI
jgi:exonuclease-1